MQNDGELPPPPYKLTDNEYSLLDETDLVFIDPMNTGYTRPVEGMKPKEWHGFKKDIELVGDFIRLYTTRANRWLSPKFLIGESYGTTRASGLAGYLQERHGMYLNGIMLVSVVLDFATLDFNIIMSPIMRSRQLRPRLVSRPACHTAVINMAGRKSPAGATTLTHVQSDMLMKANAISSKTFPQGHFGATSNAQTANQHISLLGDAANAVSPWTP
jgi:carboxypeptidase C (cathepsin A)